MRRRLLFIGGLRSRSRVVGTVEVLQIHGRCAAADLLFCRSNLLVRTLRSSNVYGSCIILRLRRSLR